MGTIEKLEEFFVSFKTQEGVSDFKNTIYALNVRNNDPIKVEPGRLGAYDGFFVFGEGMCFNLIYHRYLGESNYDNPKVFFYDKRLKGKNLFAEYASA